LVHDPVNLPVTSTPLSVYLCPTMNLPEAGVGDNLLAPGSYMISSRTMRDTMNDGAFDNASDNYHLALRHITDGTSNTLLVGEINGAFAERLLPSTSENIARPLGGMTTFAWADSYWLRSWGHMAANLPRLFNNSTDFVPPESHRTFRSDHPSGVNFVKLDGSVQLLTDDVSPEIRRALVTRAGGEVDHSFN